VQIQCEAVADVAHEGCAGGVKDEAQPEERVMPPLEYAIVSFSPHADGIED